MLNKLPALIMALIITSPVIAAYNGPWVVKSSGSGFVMPDMAAREQCEIFRDRVEINHVYGQNALKVKDIRKLVINGKYSLAALIELAAAEEVASSDNGLCDGPSTNIYANRIKPNDTIEQVILFTTGGCSSPRVQRNGPYSHMLRELINNYCPKTFYTTQ